MGSTPIPGLWVVVMLQGWLGMFITTTNPPARLPSGRLQDRYMCDRFRSDDSDCWASQSRNWTKSPYPPIGSRGGGQIPRSSTLRTKLSDAGSLSVARLLQLVEFSPKIRPKAAVCSTTCNENHPSTVRCLSHAMQGMKSVFAFCYPSAIRLLARECQ